VASTESSLEENIGKTRRAFSISWVVAVFSKALFLKL